MAPRGIAVNALRAGVADTPAGRKIPGNERLLAGAILALCHPGAGWMTGNIVNVDGGEEISAG